jgi:hypothetical protein
MLMVILFKREVPSEHHESYLMLAFVGCAIQLLMAGYFARNETEWDSLPLISMSITRSAFIAQIFTIATLPTVTGGKPRGEGHAV